MDNLWNYLHYCNDGFTLASLSLLASVIILVIALLLLLLLRLGIIQILRPVLYILIRFLGIMIDIYQTRTKSFVRFALLIPMHVFAVLIWLSALLLCVLKNSYPIPPYPIARVTRGSVNK